MFFFLFFLFLLVNSFVFFLLAPPCANFWLRTPRAVTGADGDASAQCGAPRSEVTQPHGGHRPTHVGLGLRPPSGTAARAWRARRAGAATATFARLECGRPLSHVRHLADDARVTVRHSGDETRPTSEALGFWVTVTSYASGFCPRLLKGRVPSPGTGIPVSDLASGTCCPSLMPAKPSFCALSAIGVNRGCGRDAQRLLGTRIPGWTALVVAMTPEPKPRHRPSTAS